MVLQTSLIYTLESFMSQGRGESAENLKFFGNFKADIMIFKAQTYSSKFKALQAYTKLSSMFLFSW